MLVLRVSLHWNFLLIGDVYIYQEHTCKSVVMFVEEQLKPIDFLNAVDHIVLADSAD